MTDNPAHSTWLRDATAIAIGLAVPAMVSGRAVLQGIAAAALIAVLIVAWRDRTIFARAVAAARSRLGVVVIIAFAAMAVSIPGSLDPLRSFEAWGRTLAYICGCTLFWAFLAGDARARRLCQISLILGTCTAVALVVLAQLGVMRPLNIVRLQLERVSHYWAFKEPRAFAAAAACLVPALVYLALPMRGWKIVGALAAALGLVAITVTTANKSAIAGLLALILAVSFVWALRRRKVWLYSWLAWATAVSAAGIWLVHALPDQPTLTAPWPWLPDWLIDPHRQYIWQFTMGKIAEAPWTGYGINVINRVEGAGMMVPGYHQQFLPSHPHNWILEVLGETGVIGFLPMAATLAWFFARQVHRYLLSASAAALAQIGLFAVFWSSSLFNFSIWSSWWLITFFLLSAIIAASPPATSQPASP